MTTSTNDAPYSDCFCCKELFVALATSQNAKKCIFAKFMKVEFSKHTMMKNKITKLTLENMKKLSDEWLALVVKSGYNTGKYRLIQNQREVNDK